MKTNLHLNINKTIHFVNFSNAHLKNVKLIFSWGNKYNLRSGAIDNNYKIIWHDF